jgi:hypothetical protein
MEINLDRLHPDTNLFPFGTRMSMACPHMPGAKSIYRPIKREIKETMRKGTGAITERSFVQHEKDIGIYSAVQLKLNLLMNYLK